MSYVMPTVTRTEALPKRTQRVQNNSMVKWHEITLGIIVIIAQFPQQLKPRVQNRRILRDMVKLRSAIVAPFPPNVSMRSLMIHEMLKLSRLAFESCNLFRFPDTETLMKIPSRRNEKNNQLIINKAAMGEEVELIRKLCSLTGALTPALGCRLDLWSVELWSQI